VFSWDKPKQSGGAFRNKAKKEESKVEQTPKKSMGEKSPVEMKEEKGKAQNMLFANNTGSKAPEMASFKNNSTKSGGMFTNNNVGGEPAKKSGNALFKN